MERSKSTNRRSRWNPAWSVIAVIILIGATDPAWAYIDPGRNSALHELLLGGGRGMILAISTLARTLTRRLLRGLPFGRGSG